ncbi:hypothetical protein JCM11251_002506 [Rhodosporidiobolus azoricus]
MSMLKRSLGGSINSNPLVANIDITEQATDWLWAVFAVMLVSAIVIFALGHRRPVGERAFHELGSALCFTASIAYFAMASNLGATPVEVEYIRGGTLGQNWVDLGVANPTRSIWYARYIDWTITTPMLLLELLLATGMPLSQIFMVIFMDIVMIETGLIGALVPSRYKWGFFTGGCVALVVIWYYLFFPARVSAARLGSDWHTSYTRSCILLSVLWLVYPIIWGIADGGNVIKPTGEMIGYGVLDLLAKPVFSLIHILQIERLDYARLGLSSSKVSDGAHQGLLHEKGHHGAEMGTPRASMAPSAAYGSHAANVGAVGAGPGVTAGSNTASAGDVPANRVEMA